MNKAELIDAIAKDAGLTKADAKKALEAFVTSTMKALKKNDRVALVGFGSFSVAKRAARKGRNPQSGKEIKIAAKKVVKFKPEPAVKLNGRNGAKAPVSEPMDATREFEAIKPLLGALYKFARRQIRTAVLAGELPDRFLSPDDLVDEAILNVLESRAHKSESDRRLEQVLYREVELLLSKEIAAQHPADEERVSLESSADEIERPRFALRGDEDQGDDGDTEEALHIEDVLIDTHAHSPAEAMGESEEYRALLKHLGRFHSKARSAFFLSRIEGFEPFEIAMIQNRSEEDVARDVERCAQALQQGYQRQTRGATQSMPLA
jgi:DNA-binding protein HU-beta